MTAHLHVSVPPELLERLEQARGRRSRSAFVRELLERGLSAGGADAVAADDAPEPTRKEGLKLLARAARNGSVSAAESLCRELRLGAADEPDAVDAYLAALRRDGS